MPQRMAGRSSAARAGRTSTRNRSAASPGCRREMPKGKSRRSSTSPLSPTTQARRLVPPQSQARKATTADLELGLRGRGALALEQVGQVGDRLGQHQDLLLAKGVDLFMQELDLQLRLDVDLVVVLRLLAVDILLAVLAHHDEGRRVGRLERERQVEQDEGIGVPFVDEGGDVQHDPDEQDPRLDDDEGPRSHGRGDLVGDLLADRELFGGLLNFSALAQSLAQIPQFGEQALFGLVYFLRQVVRRRHWPSPPKVMPCGYKALKRDEIKGRPADKTCPASG